MVLLKNGKYNQEECFFDKFNRGCEKMEKEKGCIMEAKGIVFPGKGSISPLVISTAFGTNGSGIFPHTLSPCYLNLLSTARKTGTTILGKSLTCDPRKGNFNLWNPRTWRFIQKIETCSMLNAYGLTNPGVESAAIGIASVIERRKLNIIPNLYPEFAKGERLAIYEISSSIWRLKFAGVPLWAVEINFSCPNSKEEISKNITMARNCVKTVKEEFSNLIVIAKTSILHPFSFYQQLEDAGADVIHGVNTIPYGLVYDTETSPLADVKGGGDLSGEVAFPKAIEYLWRLREKTSLPLIMGCGVTNFCNIDTFFSRGANAVSFCTLALRDPALARKCLKVYN